MHEGIHQEARQSILHAAGYAILRHKRNGNRGPIYELFDPHWNSMHISESLNDIIDRGMADYELNRVAERAVQVYKPLLPDKPQPKQIVRDRRLA